MLDKIIIIIGILLLTYWITGAIKEIKKKGLKNALNDAGEELLIIFIVIAILIAAKYGIRYLITIF